VGCVRGGGVGGGAAGAGGGGVADIFNGPGIVKKLVDAGREGLASSCECGGGASVEAALDVSRDLDGVESVCDGVAMYGLK
jgi:hypothetical protein